jgi:uncharacterized coiled-coil DUF342 family protein
MNIDIKQLRENIHGVVANLQALGEAGDGRQELATVKAQIDMAKRDLAGIKTEFDEVKRAHDEILRKAHEKQHELERTEAALKSRSAELNDVMAKRAAILQQLQRS